MAQHTDRPLGVWGVDMVKLDYLTPGSAVGTRPVPDSTSAAAIAYHEAIANNGRQIRLDLSSNVCRNEPYLGIWESSADSFRIAQDINASGSTKFLGSMWKVQGTVDLGIQLTTSQASIDAAEFCGGYPMQPRNPGTGSNQPMQLQAWVAGPDDNGQAYVLLTNLGVNQGKGGYATAGTGAQHVSATLSELGLAGSEDNEYTATDAWSGNVTTVKAGGSLSALLDDGNSQFLRLTLAKDDS